jgi:hypothetical protein
MKLQKELNSVWISNEMKKDEVLDEIAPRGV